MGSTVTPQIFWIETPWRGRLAIMARPRGGDWLRDELQAWKDANLETIVCLLTSEELTELGLEAEASIGRELGIEFVSFPVADRDIPAASGKAQDLVRELAKRIQAGHNLGIHCRMGLGRSAMFAASILVLAGIDPETAFHNIAAVRGYAVPDTTEQKNWTVRFADGLQKTNA